MFSGGFTSPWVCFQVALFEGRQLEYAVPGASPAQEEGFFTLVRYTQEHPQGKATALLNWTRGIMEVRRSGQSNAFGILFVQQSTDVHTWRGSFVAALNSVTSVFDSHLSILLESSDG